MTSTDKLSLLEVNKEYLELVRTIQKHDDLYYNQDAPIISDSEYDKLRRRLVQLEELYPILKIPNSPSNKVGAPVENKFKKVKHEVPMLSLENAFSLSELNKFITKAENFIGVNAIDKFDYCCEQKIDGLSVSLIYEEGKLTVASTRGDGYIGEDVTQNVKQVKDIPHEISITDRVEIRGEIYMPISTFKNLNNRQKLKGKNLFVTTRNAAAGSLRQLNPQVTASRDLHFFAYYLTGINLETQIKTLDKLRELGFVVCDYEHCNNTDEFQQYFLKIQKIRSNLDYAIDGVVLKINDLALQTQLGFINRNPRHSVAYKFPAEVTATKLLGIDVNVGRTGKLTPVAILKPVQLGGVTISRATLHNFKDISEKCLCIGDDILLERSGDVIPKIISIERKADNPVQIIAPSICPSCNTELISTNKYVDVFCPNRYGCPAQILAYIKHFASKQCFDIKGLGEKQIKDLYTFGIIHSPIDLFELKRLYEKYNLAQKPGWGILLIQNLLDAIEHSRSISFHKFINALGILDIGNKIAKDLAMKFKNIENLMKVDDKQLQTVEGLGDIKIQNILHFIHNSINVRFITNILQYIKII